MSTTLLQVPMRPLRGIRWTLRVQRQYAKGEMVSYQMATGEPVGDLSAANRGLPPRSCAVWFESAEFPATYGISGKLWLVDCCDDAAVGTLYQASAPDWNA